MKKTYFNLLKSWCITEGSAALMFNLFSSDPSCIYSIIQTGMWTKYEKLYHIKNSLER